MGSMQLRNIIAGGGLEEIYPVHPRLDKIQGFKGFYYTKILENQELS